MSDSKPSTLISTDGKSFLPNLSIDTVIFGFHQEQLKILVLKYKNTELFALPGGFVGEKENLHDAARRILSVRTGLHDIYLDQFYTFGNCTRQNKTTLRTILAGNGMEVFDDHWLLGRFVSVGYYALVDFTKAIPIPDPLSDSCTWYDLSNLPLLMLDHHQMVQKALETLRYNLDSKLIGFNLLPEAFTMTELQSLYETIMGHPLRRSSFQRKMLSLGILERVSKKFTGGAHKAPYLYRFVTRKQPS